MLSPVDLAVSKLSRFDEEDRNDIRRLAQVGLLEEKEFRVRAGEALATYVGQRDRVRLSIELACKVIAESLPGARASKPRRR